jgi:hypothetical protein
MEFSGTSRGLIVVEAQAIAAIPDGDENEVRHVSPTDARISLGPGGDSKK